MPLNKEQKSEIVEILKEKFETYSNVYITDTESLTVAQFASLRKACFDKEVEMKVAKNTLIRRAIESLEEEKFNQALESLKGVTALMFSDTPKNPAVILSDFRGDKGEKPVLKAAIIGEEFYAGDDKLGTLKSIKSKEELIGDVLTLLQSPMSNLLGALENKENATGKAEEPAVDEPATEEAPAAETEAPAEEAPAMEETPKAEAPAADATDTEEKAEEKSEEKEDTPAEGETDSEDTNTENA